VYNLYFKGWVCNTIKKELKVSDTLVLNADGNPVSFLPLSTINWQEAIRYMVLDKADVLAWHDNWIVRSANWETPVPSVIILRDYMKAKSSVRFSRSNIYLRDDGTCQYCYTPIDKKEATLDHVLPTSKGGKTTWENCCTACGPCNASKGNNHKIVPKKKPHKPGYYELVNKRKKQPFNVRHQDWLQYLL
jgi:5-methylcytosine-specific restriction endonuclease McrA